MEFGALDVIAMYATLALARCGATGRRLANAQPAQSTVEYALIGALIVVVASAAVMALGGTVNNVFQQLSTALKSGKSGG
jgi:Flp pilus assembly pilin Flp